MLQQIELIERQIMEIEKCYQALKTTQEEEARQGVTQDKEVSRQVLSQEEVSQEGSRQEVVREDTEVREVERDENESWQQQSRHIFICPICGLGRKTKGQIEKYIGFHDKQNDDSQFNCKDCQYQTINRDH